MCIGYADTYYLRSCLFLFICGKIVCVYMRVNLFVWIRTFFPSVLFSLCENPVFSKREVYNTTLFSFATESDTNILVKEICVQSYLNTTQLFIYLHICICSYEIFHETAFKPGFVFLFTSTCPDFMRQSSVGIFWV